MSIAIGGMPVIAFTLILSMALQSHLDAATNSEPQNRGNALLGSSPE
ncbi:MAG TPA: hypothetical protein VF681_07875 [Abditibacteriaceae bacterium]